MMYPVKSWWHWLAEMKTFRRALCLGVFGLALTSAGTASAQCLIPIGPAQTSRDDVLSLHRFGEGSRLCIHAFQRKNSCANCKRGYWHDCKGGWWIPTLACEAKDAIKQPERDRSKVRNDRKKQFQNWRTKQNRLKDEREIARKKAKRDRARKEAEQRRVRQKKQQRPRTSGRRYSATQCRQILAQIQVIQNNAGAYRARGVNVNQLISANRREYNRGCR